MSFTPPSPQSPPPFDLSTLVLPEDPQGPFPAPSEPLQYRAIGIVRGRYEPSEERITQGKLHTSDGVTIDAVLLGRVLSLVRKHLDLAAEHPWVVYPRTRDGGGLHTQIVGVWSLNPNGLRTVDQETTAEDQDHDDDLDEDDDLDDLDEDDEDLLDEDEASLAQADTESKDESANHAEAADADDDSDRTLLFSTANLDGIDGFFSVRGEVTFQSQQEGFILVKIRQQGKKKKPGRAFKLRLEGNLPDNARGQFWDLEVRRTTESLTIQDGTPIAQLPRMAGKRPPGKGGGRRPPGKGGFQRGDRGEGGGLRPPRSDRGEGRPIRPERGDRPERPFRPIDRPPRPPAQ
jgi:hypothetical protein